MWSYGKMAEEEIITVMMYTFCILVMNMPCLLRAYYEFIRLGIAFK